jgi:uncharacterized protein (TIGR00369 family)
MEAGLTNQSFDSLFGLEVLELSHDGARGRVAVRDELKVPPGVVHAGVYAAAAQGLASLATAGAVADGGRVAIGLANHTSVLHPITEGAIEAVAIARHRGRTTWVWQVEMSDVAGRLCVISRVTVSVRPANDHRGAGGAPRPSQ